MPPLTTPSPSRRPAYLLLVFFILGLASVTVQTTLIREFLVAFHGNELCLGLFFGVWLLWISLGAALGSWVSRRLRSADGLFHLCVLLGAASPLLQIYYIRIVRYVLNPPAGLYIPFHSMSLFALVVLLPFSTMIGFTFPLGCRLYAERRGPGPTAIGWLYVLESCGFLLGGLLFTFILAHHYNAYANAALTLGLVLAVCVFGSFGAMRPAAQLAFRVLSLAILAGLCVLSPLVLRLDRLSIQRRWESLETRLELLTTADSKYENIAVGESSGQYSVFADGFYMFSFPNEYDYAPSANYVLTQHPRPRKVLLLGNGTQGLLRELLSAGVAAVDHVELDPKITETIQPYLPAADARLLSDPRVRYFHADSRYFVKQAQAVYDIIFVNMPDPSTAMLNRFYTIEFFREAQRALAPGGVLALRITSAENYIGELVGDYSGSVFHTLRRVFKNIAVSHGDSNNLFASDADNVVTTDIKELTRRYAQRGIQSQHFTTAHFEFIYQPTRVEFTRQKLMERQSAKINTDLRPITYFYNLMLWDNFSGSHLRPVFRFLERTNIIVLVLVLVVVLVARLGFVKALRRDLARQARFNALAAMAACGFSAMAFEIILIFAFQSMYGYLYHMIGLIVALFMAGLALGGLAANLSLRGLQSEGKALILVQVVTAAFALGLPSALMALSSPALAAAPLAVSQALFMALILAAGFLGGLEFPIVSSLYLKHSTDTARTGGLVDAADHLGAFLGALLS
ncbi:MAG: hypothetical protein FJ279_02050, partial [Planctomycetes bacterium]|nr:hypothetical protein [Planctomycetota bacterium]